MRHESKPVDALRQAVRVAGTQAKLAREWGVSQVYISDLINGRRGFSDAVLARLGLQRVVVNRKEVA